MSFTSIKSKWISFWCLVLFGVSGGKAQIAQTGRIEIPINQDVEAHQIMSLDSAGIMLFRNYSAPATNQIELTRLDTALSQVWHGFVAVSKDFSFVRAKAEGTKACFFFRGTTIAQGYLVLIANIKDGSYFFANIKMAIPFNATEFIVSKESILIGGYFNYRPLVLHYSLKTDRSHVLPGFLNEPGELNQIKTYNNGNVDVILSAKNASRRKCIWVKHFDEHGELIKTTVIEPEEKKHLIFGRATKMIDNNQVIAGVYGRNSVYVRGIFVADVNAFGEYKIHYYNFGDLKNFFHYMRAKKEKRIKDRIERRRIKGKKIKFNYRLLVHEVIPYNDQFIMLGEAFIPRYSSRSFGSPAGRSYSPWQYGMLAPTYRGYNNDLIFDGYQYTHAVAIGFDKDANLTWDNSFEINGIKVFQLEQFVKIFPHEDHIVLVYMFENALRSKIIRGDQVIEGANQTAMSSDDSTKILDTRAGKLEYWYNQHFFVSGVQTVKSGENSRRVFFINKLRAN